MGINTYVGPDVEKTLLPFLNSIFAAQLFGGLVVLIAVVYIIRRFVYKYSLTFRRAPTAEVFYSIITTLMNCVLYLFFYWYIALPITLVLSFAFMKAVQMEVKEANEDERIGVWGLNKDIRLIRGELFNDMSIEEQLEYTSKVKEYRFSRIRYMLVCVGIPLLIMAALYFLNCGYLWFPTDVPK